MRKTDTFQISRLFSDMFLQFILQFCFCFRLFRSKNRWSINTNSQNRFLLFQMDWIKSEFTLFSYAQFMCFDFPFTHLWTVWFHFKRWIQMINLCLPTQKTRKIEMAAEMMALSKTVVFEILCATEWTD